MSTKPPSWCGPCVIERLLEERKASLGALDIDPGRSAAADRLVERFYRRERLRQRQSTEGPYPDDGREADTPQHCDTCGVFLENPLTTEGYRYVNENLIEHARDGDGDA